MGLCDLQAQEEKTCCYSKNRTTVVKCVSMHIFKLFLMSEMKQNMGYELDLYSSMQSVLSILQRSGRKQGSILTTAFLLDA